MLGGRMCPQLRKQEHKEKLNVSLAPPKCHRSNKEPPYTSAECRITPFLSHRFDTSALSCLEPRERRSSLQSSETNFTATGVNGCESVKEELPLIDLLL